MVHTRVHTESCFKRWLSSHHWDHSQRSNTLALPAGHRAHWHPTHRWKTFLISKRFILKFALLNIIVCACLMLRRALRARSLRVSHRFAFSMQDADSAKLWAPRPEAVASTELTAFAAFAGKRCNKVAQHCSNMMSFARSRVAMQCIGLYALPGVIFSSTALFTGLRT
jgi:hypothetical protein